jgi:hypothetical protein
MRCWHKAAIAMLVVSLLLAVVFPFIPRTARAGPEPSWWDTNWDYRKRLTFENGGQIEDLVNFPVMVKLIPDNFTYAYCQADGDDIRFIDADDSTELDYHFEQWTYDGTSWIWVEVPQIDGGSATDYIWLYYGNSGAGPDQDEEGTYNGNFVGVWHLHDDFLDSTAFGNNGTNQGSTDTGAKIADGQVFNASNSEYVEINSVAGNISTAAGTIEAWIKMSSGMVADGATRGIVEIGHNTSAQDKIALMKNTEDTVRAEYRVTGTSHWAANCNLDVRTYAANWKNVTGVWNATHVLVYENGSLIGTANRSADINPLNLNQAIIGADATLAIDEFFDGAMDEVRISDVARSDDWIKAQYLSMSDAFINYIDIELAGWGWCPDEPRGIGNVSFPVSISAVPRSDAPESSDINLYGTLNLTYNDNTTRTFSLNLTGIKPRSLFHLRQNELDANGEAVGAAFNGPWLTWNNSGVEEHYIGGAGIIWLPHGNLSKTVKPYYFLLRTPDVNISVGTLGTGFVGSINNIIYSFTRGFDTTITALMDTGFRDTVGNVLDSTAVIIREVRDRIGPYFP